VCSILYLIRLEKTWIFLEEKNLYTFVSKLPEPHVSAAIKAHRVLVECFSTSVLDITVGFDTSVVVSLKFSNQTRVSCSTMKIIEIERLKEMTHSILKINSTP
jgi:hypothetical protein